MICYQYEFSKQPENCTLWHLEVNSQNTPKEAEEGIGEWMRFYNHERTHQAIERKTPEQVYLNSKSIKELAA